MLDMVKPRVEGKITLSDLKACKMTPLFFDTFFNLEKYLEHEQKDPFANVKVLYVIISVETLRRNLKHDVTSHFLNVTLRHTIRCTSVLSCLIVAPWNIEWNWHYYRMHF